MERHREPALGIACAGTPQKEEKKRACQTPLLHPEGNTFKMRN
jgi:hypothetical protein